LISLSTTTTRAQSPDTILVKGNIAPFYGILVTPERYKEYTFYKLAYKDLKAKEPNYLNENPFEITLFNDVTFRLAVVSFILGAGAVLIATH
jgi:hypothetical protein